MALRKTVLAMVQEILESMDSDTVASISDTAESAAVASIIENTYWDMVTAHRIPEHWTLFELTASGDSSQPTIMTIPDTVLELNWIKYNNKLTSETSPNYEDVLWMDSPQFFERMHTMDSANTNVITFSRTIGGDTIDFLAENDKMPSYYTTFDDDTLVFDSYDASEDTTLVSDKTQCHGLVVPTFTKSDAFVPDLDSNLFPLLFNEAKATCFNDLKQITNNSTERKARKQRINLQKYKHKAKQPQPYYDRLPNYGRK